MVHSPNCPQRCELSRLQMWMQTSFFSLTFEFTSKDLRFVHVEMANFTVHLEGWVLVIQTNVSWFWKHSDTSWLWITVLCRSRWNNCVKMTLWHSMISLHSLSSQNIIREIPLHAKVEKHEWKMLLPWRSAYWWQLPRFQDSSMSSVTVLVGSLAILPSWTRKIDDLMCLKLPWNLCCSLLEMHRVVKLRWNWHQVSTVEPLWSFGKMWVFWGYAWCFKSRALKAWEVDLSCKLRHQICKDLRGEVNFTLAESEGFTQKRNAQQQSFEAWVLLIMVIFYAITLLYITARRLFRKKC